MNRLGEKVVGARLDALHAFLRGIEGRDHDHRQHLRRRVRADLAADVVAAHARHHNVEQHEIELMALDRLQRFGPRGRSQDGVALGAEHVG